MVLTLVCRRLTIGGSSAQEGAFRGARHIERPTKDFVWHAGVNNIARPVARRLSMSAAASGLELPA